MRLRLSIFVIFTIVLVTSPNVFAQADIENDGNNADSIEAAAADIKDSSDRSSRFMLFDSDNFPSILFTYWEQVAIEDAKRSRGLRRAPTESELERELNLRRGQKDLSVKPPPAERDISLSGIVFKGATDWTIWLNGKRVTPDALPDEILDLKVFEEYIEVKWYDIYTNKIFPIRLRPHQRFNIDTRIFLPG